MLWWQKMGKDVNYVKLAIPSESEPHYGEKPAKWPKLTILSQCNPHFWKILPFWVIFSQLDVKGIKKVEKLKEFWAIMGKNLQNDQNWPFWANLTHFFSKIHHSGSFLATLVWKELKKLKNSKNYGQLWEKTCRRTKIGYFETM